MKRNILLVIIVIFTLNVNAQNVKFGTKAGLNISSIYNGENVNRESRYSFHLGGLVEFKISNKIYFQPEILFSSQGAKFNYSGESIDILGGVNSTFFSIESTTALNYLNFPLIMKYYIFNNLSIECGPQLGFLLSLKTETTHTNNNAFVTETSSDKSSSNIIDLGINFGLGYKLENGIFFNSRYNFGLSAINKELENQIYYTKARNGVLQISVGYFFN